MKNLVDQKFGKLLVVSKNTDKITTKKRGYWNCICDCGKNTVVNTTKLTSGYTNSCGCIRSPNLLGIKFNNLTVISKIEKNKQKNTHQGFEWKCVCDCGNFRTVSTNRLTDGAIKSCGCTHIQKTGSESHKWCGYGEISGSYFCSLRNGAEDRNIEFNVTIEELWELFIKQNRKCALSGLEINFSLSKEIEKTASLDRIDSSKEYVIGNIQWVHKHINMMKMDYDEKYFIELCKLITATQQIEKY